MERNPVRDRVLVLRVLVPSLAQALRDKMKDANDTAASKLPPSSSNSSSHTSGSTDYLTKETLLDLDGVTCAPIKDGSTQWQLLCDGAAYPARLVNLPCPVEVHKTHDNVMYYKSCDIAQMLIVYEDEMAMEEAENIQGYRFDEYPSYYHSGLTPPLKRVVERRFTAREHKAVPPPRSEVAEMEEELKKLVDRIQEAGGTGGRSKAKPKASAQVNRVIEDVVDEIVDYEPWMDDQGRLSHGIEVDVDAEDGLVTKHPELFLIPSEIIEVTKAEEEKEERQKEKAAAKKTKKPKKKKQTVEDKSSVKKGIAKKKPVTDIDEATQAAAAMLSTDGDLDVLGAELDNFDDLFNFDGGDEFGDMDFT